LPEAPEALWEELEETKIEDIDEFVKLFSRQAIQKKPTESKKSNIVSKVKVSFEFIRRRSPRHFRLKKRKKLFCFSGCKNLGLETVSVCWNTRFQSSNGFL